MGKGESHTRRTKMTRDVRRSLLLSHTAEETEKGEEWFMAFAYRVKTADIQSLVCTHISAAHEKEILKDILSRMETLGVFTSVSFSPSPRFFEEDATHSTMALGSSKNISSLSVFFPFAISKHSCSLRNYE